MSLIYLVALIAVGCIILCALVEAVASVTRKAHWETIRRPVLVEVETVDSRRQDLPFVGADRRRTRAEAQAMAAQDRMAG